MNKKTITLRESELIRLITETVTELRLQEQKPDHLMPFQPDNPVYTGKVGGITGGNLTPEDLVAGAHKAMADIQTNTKGPIHIIIDMVSIIAYLACGITAGIGCLISVAADVLNAYLYIEYEDDYYMAGMQMAFSMVPFGEGMKWGAKAAKPYLGPFFKSIYQAGSRVSKKQMVKFVDTAIKSMTPAQLKQARKLFPQSYLKVAKNTFKESEAAIRPYFSKIPGLETVWTKCTVLIRALWLFVEMIWFDPEHVGGLLKLTGDWLGFETLTSWGEAMEDWPKWGVKLTNKFYTSTGIGGFRALVQTSIADCNNTVYVWEYAKEQYITQNNIEEINFDEDKMEADWWNGWRPIAQVEGGKSGRRRMPTEEDTVAMELIKDDYNMYAQYAALKECKKMTEGKTYGPWLTSCSKFKSMYTTLNPEERFEMLMYFIDADSEGEC